MGVLWLGMSCTLVPSSFMISYAWPGTERNRKKTEQWTICFLYWTFTEALKNGNTVWESLLTRFLKRCIWSARIARFCLAFVDVTFEVADHVCFSGNGDGAYHTMVVCNHPARTLEDVHTLEKTDKKKKNQSCFLFNSTVLCLYGASRCQFISLKSTPEKRWWGKPPWDNMKKKHWEEPDSKWK